MNKDLLPSPYLLGLATVLYLVAYPAPRSRKYFCSPTNKSAKLKVKNRRKSSEEAKTENLLFVTSVIFRNTFFLYKNNFIRTRGSFLLKI